MRIFSDVYYRTSPDEFGISLEKRVPIKWGDMSRQAANILSGNTENVTLTAPSMATWIYAVSLDDSRRQDPTWVSKIVALEREFKDGKYTSDQGNTYSIERYMPVPYLIKFQLDIWTSNTDTKLQILEQLMMIFNTSLQLQQNDSVFDWTSIFEVFLTEILWTNRTIPQGTDTSWDFATMKFEVPVWISPPAKEMRAKVIKDIITEVKMPGMDMPGYLQRCIVTSDRCSVKITENELDNNTNIAVLLAKGGIENDDVTWDSIVKSYGKIIPDYTKLVVKTDDDHTSTDGDIYGTFISVTGNKAIIRFDTETVPYDQTVHAIIDPLHVWPNANKPINQLPPGNKFLLIPEVYDSNDPAISEYNSRWGGFSANSGDIIEYINGEWVVVFDSNNPIDENGDEIKDLYIKCHEDGQYYHFNKGDWTFTFLGKYNPGYWSIDNFESED